MTLSRVFRALYGASLAFSPLPSLTQQPATVSASTDVKMGLQRDAALAATIAEISAAQIRATDSALVSFGTRHAMSDTMSATRGIGAARRYLFNKLSSYSQACGGCQSVQSDPESLEKRAPPDKPMINIVNVVAWLP